MSTYTAPTIHPETGKIEMAVWIDDLPHPHWYTVEFPDGKRFDPRECEQVGPKAMAEIERLRHDIERYVSTCAAQAQEIERLRKGE